MLRTGQRDKGTISSEVTAILQGRDDGNLDHDGSSERDEK